MNGGGTRVTDVVPAASAPAADQASRLRALVDGPRAAAGSAAPRPPLAIQPEGRPPRPEPRPRRAAKIVAVASGKGGVGKTNIAVNISIALAALGIRVTLLDADLGTANADVLCGLMPGARLDEVVRSGWGGRSMRDIAIQAPGGFTLVPGTAGIARMADLTPAQRQRLMDAMAELEHDADVLVIDTAAGVGASVTSFLRIADLGLVVTTPEPTAVADAYALIKCAVGPRAAGTTPAGVGGGEAQHRVPLSLLVNQVADGAEAAGVHARVAAVCGRFLGLPLGLAGHVAHDLRVLSAVRARRPFVLTHPRCEASRDMRQVAMRVAQQIGVGRSSEGRETGPTGLSALFARLLGGHGSESQREMLKSVR